MERELREQAAEERERNPNVVLPDESARKLFELLPSPSSG